MGRKAEKNLSWPEKLGYGLGGITMAMIMCLGNYLTVYLTNTALLDIAVVSTILAVSRIFDGISDIFVGNLIDSTLTIHGKARVWIRRCALPLAVSAILLYYVPKTWPDGARYVYVFLIYNLFSSVFATFFIVSHNALLPLITSDRSEHRQLSSIAGFFQMTAFMLTSSVFVKLLLVFASEPENPMTQRGYTCSVILIVCLMAILCIAEFYLTREKTGIHVTGSEPVNDSTKTSLIKDLKVLFANKYWTIMLFATLLLYLAATCFDGAMRYYTIYVMGDFEAMAQFNFAIGVGGIIATIALFALGSRIGTSKLFTSSVILRIIGVIGIYFAGNNNSFLLITSLAVVGLGTGSAPVLMQALITEILIYSKKTSGKLIPGLGNACMNAARKLGLGSSMAAFGYIMAMAGFDAKLDAQGISQPDSVISAINTGFFLIPIVLYIVIVVVFLLFFDMDKKVV